MLTTYLLTGAGGFLGQSVQQYLTAAGYTVTTLGRQASNDIVCDLSTRIPLIPLPADVVVHAAGKAHTVPKTTAEKQAFFAVNTTGTKHLCQGLEKTGTLPKAFVFISTAAVYGKEEGENISELDPLQGSTPYAQSKIAAEQFLQQWCAANGVKLSILRLPLIAGPNPPGNLGAMIRGIKTGYYFTIDGGQARKSIVMAGDVAAAIPVIADTGGVYNLTDGYHPGFAELATLIATQAGKPVPRNMPLWLAKSIALAGNLLGNKAPINTATLRKITATLTFDDSTARRSFNWQPHPVLKTFRIT